MEIHGLPETFWVVTKPSPVSELADICFPCTFERLMLQARGGLNEDEIVGIYADEAEATEGGGEAAGRVPRPSPGRPRSGSRGPRHGHPERRGDDRRRDGEGGRRGGEQRRP